MAYGQEMRLPDLRASSAGTRAVIAHPMHVEASKVLASLGGDPSDFAARQLTPRIASEPDLIITMTKSHRDRVLELAPHRLRSTFSIVEAAKLISNFNAHNVVDLAMNRPQLAAAEVWDIPDPLGQESGYFAMVAKQIASLLPPILALCDS